MQIFLDALINGTLIDFGSEAGGGTHGGYLGGRKQRGHVALMLLQLFPNSVGAVASLFSPLRVRVHAQVMLPVIERLVVEELMLGYDGAIEERDRIVGVESQGLAQVFVGSAEIFFAVFLLGALEVGGG